MKKVKFIMIIFYSMVFLSGCTNNEKEVKENKKVKDDTVIEQQINDIESSKKVVAKNSLYNYVLEIDNYISLAQMDFDSYNKNNVPKDGTICTITNNTIYNSECSELLKSITIKGIKPESGMFKINNQKVSYAKLVFNGYTVEYDGNVAKVLDI